MPQLKTDPRFRNSPLSPNQQLQLFRSHIEHLHQKHMANLHGLFQSHSLSLATPFSELPFESLLKSLPATKLGLNIEQLEHEYDKWQRERTTSSKFAFNEMLAENSFIEFWGRLTKIGGEGVEGGVKADDIGDDEGEGGGGKVDMKALAKKVDLEEMEKVLKVELILLEKLIAELCVQNDKRYMTFDHIPEQREKWLRVTDVAHHFGHSCSDGLSIGIHSKSCSTETIRSRSMINIIPFNGLFYPATTRICLMIQITRRVLTTTSFVMR